MNLEEQIRACAKRGMSRQMTREVLGLSQYMLTLLSGAMPDVEWPKRGNSIGEKMAREKLRGQCSPRRREVLNKAVAARLEKVPKVELCGVVAATKRMYELWADYAEVSYPQFRRRFVAGWPLIEALFKPATDRASRWRGCHVRAA